MRKEAGEGGNTRPPRTPKEREGQRDRGGMSGGSMLKIEYVFTWANWDGPCVERHDTAEDLLAWAAGWQRESGGATLLIFRSPCLFEVRA